MASAPTTARCRTSRAGAAATITRRKPRCAAAWDAQHGCPHGSVVVDGSDTHRGSCDVSDLAKDCGAASAQFCQGAVQPVLPAGADGDARSLGHECLSDGTAKAATPARDNGDFAVPQIHALVLLCGWRTHTVDRPSCDQDSSAMIS